METSNIEKEFVEINGEIVDISNMPEWEKEMWRDIPFLIDYIKNIGKPLTLEL